MDVELREITADTVRAICALEVAAAQRDYVADNAFSLAQALFLPEAWYRAIYADGEPAGFVMLYDEGLRSRPPASPALELWRFMVAADRQGLGIGHKALALVLRHARERGVAELRLSYVPGDHSPEDFYRGFGFEPTGEVEDGEVIMRVELANA